MSLTTVDTTERKVKQARSAGCWVGYWTVIGFPVVSAKQTSCRLAIQKNRTNRGKGDFRFFLKQLRMNRNIQGNGRHEVAI